MTEKAGRLIWKQSKWAGTEGEQAPTEGLKLWTLWVRAWRGELGGGGKQEGKKLQRSILSENSCLKKKKKSSPKLILNSKENKGGCTAADRKWGRSVEVDYGDVAGGVRMRSASPGRRWTRKSKDFSGCCPWEELGQQKGRLSAVPQRPHVGT